MYTGHEMPLLSMHPTMDRGDWSRLPSREPSQYEVDGLPAAVAALIDKDYGVNPLGWKISLRLRATGVWVDIGPGRYESPEDALAVLRAAFPA